MTMTLKWGQPTDMVGLSRRAERVSGIVPTSHLVVETYWGYIVRPELAAPLGLMIAQAVAGFLGVACTVAGIALWVLPFSGLAVDGMPLRMGASAFILSIALLFLWFASRGTRRELQVDTRLRELREVVRNKYGTSTLMGRISFDGIGSVFIARNHDPKHRSRLVLRIGNTARLIAVAEGSDSDLGELRNRLGRDLLPAEMAGPATRPTPAADVIVRRRSQGATAA